MTFVTGRRWRPRGTFTASVMLCSTTGGKGDFFFFTFHFHFWLSLFSPIMFQGNDWAGSWHRRKKSQRDGWKTLGLQERGQVQINHQSWIVIHQYIKNNKSSITHLSYQKLNCFRWPTVRQLRGWCAMRRRGSRRSTTGRTTIKETQIWNKRYLCWNWVYNRLGLN